ncbi:unnamed protein product [Choristocarpus tenellus]
MRVERMGSGQLGRAVWGADGSVVFYLSAAGIVYKISVLDVLDGEVLARAELPGGATPSTLRLLPSPTAPSESWEMGEGKGDREENREGYLFAATGKGMCLVPCKNLDLKAAVFYGDKFSVGQRTSRFWGACGVGVLSGRSRPHGALGSTTVKETERTGVLQSYRSSLGRNDTYNTSSPGSSGLGGEWGELSFVGNPVKARDEKADLFVYNALGGQPERVPTPRSEGVLHLACSPLRPLVVAISPLGEAYLREQVLKTDFPGPWFPSGYVLVENNVPYLETEDEIDTVVTSGPRGEARMTPAHQVVVPWQHEAGGDEEGNDMDEEIDVFNGADTYAGPWSVDHFGEEELHYRPIHVELPRNSRSLGDGEEEGDGVEDNKKDGHESSVRGTKRNYSDSSDKGSGRGAGDGNSNGVKPLFSALLNAPKLFCREHWRWRKRLREEANNRLDKRRCMVGAFLGGLEVKLKKVEEEQAKKRKKQKLMLAKKQAQLEKAQAIAISRDYQQAAASAPTQISSSTLKPIPIIPKLFSEGGSAGRGNWTWQKLSQRGERGSARDEIPELKQGPELGVGLAQGQGFVGEGEGRFRDRMEHGDNERGGGGGDEMGSESESSNMDDRIGY